MDASRLTELRSYFQEVVSILGRRLSRSSPRVVALVAKWNEEDLVPGLSDMDFRIVCDDQTTPEDWVGIDRTTAEVHLEMVRGHPEWNRINEHTAGSGMTIAEVMDPRFYNPEYAIWHLWRGQEEWFDDLKSYVSSRPFDYSDEHFHLERFLTYYSPYIHGIDPGHNLGEFRDKYPLHSRCWHYFTPPMLSAACLLARKNFTGKLEGLMWLRDNGFIAGHIDAVLAQVEAHYETPELTDAGLLQQFEAFLFKGFEELYRPLCEAARELPIGENGDPSEVKRQLASNQPEPMEMLMEHVRWARFRGARYYFYLNSPDHFDADWLMQMELVWTRKLTQATFDIARRALGATDLTLEQCLNRLDIQPGPAQRDALDHMFKMAAWSEDEALLRRLYHRAVDLYPHYYRLLEELLANFAARSAA